jgi:hypothetical protein
MLVCCTPWLNPTVKPPEVTEVTPLALDTFCAKGDIVKPPRTDGGAAVPTEVSIITAALTGFVAKHASKPKPNTAKLIRSAFTTILAISASCLPIDDEPPMTCHQNI